MGAAFKADMAISIGRKEAVSVKIFGKGGGLWVMVRCLLGGGALSLTRLCLRRTHAEGGLETSRGHLRNSARWWRVVPNALFFVQATRSYLRKELTSSHEVIPMIGKANSNAFCHSGRSAFRKTS